MECLQFDLILRDSISASLIFSFLLSFACHSQGPTTNEPEPSSFASRESHTAHSLKSEGPYYLPDPAAPRDQGTDRRDSFSLIDKKVGIREGYPKIELD